MGKKSRRQRVPNAASRRGVDIETARRKVNSSPSASTLSPEQRAAAVAAAEAECQAAMAAAAPLADNVLMTPESHPRLFQANSELMDAVSLDEDDNANLHQYLLRQVEGDKESTLSLLKEMIKVIKRWPRIRKYWPRLQRRFCWGCGRQHDLSEPRLWVCSSCGEARYCDEACQRAHWLDHRSQCFETLERRIKKRVSEGTPKPEVRREFRHLLDVFAMPRNM